MGGVVRADLLLRCKQDSTLDTTATVALHSLLLQSLPALQELMLDLPGDLEDQIDRWGQLALAPLSLLKLISGSMALVLLQHCRPVSELFTNAPASTTAAA